MIKTYSMDEVGDPYSDPFGQWVKREDLNNIQAEVERLQDQCNHLVEKFKAEIEVSYAKRKSAEQERDQLKANLVRIRDIVEGDPSHVYAFSAQSLALHDAEVIEQMLSNMCYEKSMTMSHYKCAELMQWMRGYVEQLRQQAKEVQS